MLQVLAAISLALALSSGALAQTGPVGPIGPVGPAGASAQATNPTGSTPVPDPTKLTQEAVDRAVAQLKELFNERLVQVEKRLDRQAETLLERPEEIDKAVATAIGALQALMVQKFIGVDQQFAGRDTALAAALLAQKTAVDEQNKSNALSIAKSDAATTKQIDTIGLNIDTKTQSINDKVDDLRQRVQSIESRAIGAGDNKADSGANWTWIFGAIGALVGLFSLIGVFGFAVMHRSETGRPRAR